MLNRVNCLKQGKRTMFLARSSKNLTFLTLLCIIAGDSPDYRYEECHHGDAIRFSTEFGVSQGSASHHKTVHPTRAPFSIYAHHPTA